MNGGLFDAVLRIQPPESLVCGSHFADPSCRAPGGRLFCCRFTGIRPQASVMAASTTDFSMNLYKKGDFVSQATIYWCIGASMQMMLNVIGVTDDARRASQERNMRMARSVGDSLNTVRGACGG